MSVNVRQQWPCMVQLSDTVAVAQQLHKSPSLLSCGIFILTRSVSSDKPWPEVLLKMTGGFRHNLCWQATAILQAGFCSMGMHFEIKKFCQCIANFFGEASGKVLPAHYDEYGLAGPCALKRLVASCISEECCNTSKGLKHYRMSSWHVLQVRSK